MVTRNPNLDRLLQEWRLLHRRYGMRQMPPELQRLELSIKRRATQIRYLRSEIAELESKLDALESESEGIDKTLELVVSEAIATLLDEHVEAWSPVPVLGFRIWDVGPSGFHGFKQQWTTPHLEAECLTTRDNPEEVPHTDGICGEPACGIYAAKDPASLHSSAGSHPQSRIAIGLVGMSGKVVEHEMGYRAAEATVLALGVPQKHEPFLTGDHWQIESLFTNKSTIDLLLLAMTDDAPNDPERQIHQISEFLRDEERRRSQWTLASPSES